MARRKEFDIQWVKAKDLAAGDIVGEGGYEYRVKYVFPNESGKKLVVVLSSPFREGILTVNHSRKFRVAFPRKNPTELNPMAIQSPHQAFDVYLHGRVIDTVFYGRSAKMTAEEVKQSLINHDGYDYRIEVKKVRSRRCSNPRMNPTDQQVRERFDRCVIDVGAKGGTYNPEAVCAATMRRAYGSQFTRIAAEGRSLAAAERHARGMVRARATGRLERRPPSRLHRTAVQRRGIARRVAREQTLAKRRAAAYGREVQRAVRRGEAIPLRRRGERALAAVANPVTQRYAAWLMVPDKYSASWSARELGDFKTIKSAEKRLRQVLRSHPSVGTRYKRERRPFFGEVYDKKSGRVVSRIEAEEVTVPSVGELGYF